MKAWDVPARASAASSEVATRAPSAEYPGWRLSTTVWRPGRGRPIPSHVVLPMISQWPMVRLRKRRRSAARRQGRRLALQMTPLAATAAISDTGMAALPHSYGDRRLDPGVGVVVVKREGREAEVEQRGHRRVQDH